MPGETPALIRETFPVGPLQCNCTIIGDPVTKKAVVVDPGGNPDLIMARLDKHGLKVVSIIHTHAHLDHFLASGQMKEKTGDLAFAQGGSVPLGQPGDAVPHVWCALHAGAGAGSVAQ